MKLLDIIAAPWAINETRLFEIRELYLAHTRREKLDLKAWEAVTGQPAGGQREPYTVQDGVAIIPVQGVMAKAPGAWGRLCGMTGTAQIRSDLQTALEDPSVHSVCMLFDSPGGTVDGTQELASDIFSARSQKPIVAFADGCMCSAGYWAGSACERVYIASDTTETGSIGVVATHVDQSQAESQTGRRTTEITAGKYKRIASQYAPLSEEGRATIQAQVDHIYSVFVDEVAKFRGVSVDTVLSDMADGRVFLGKQAIDAGLVDGVSTLSSLVAQLNDERRNRTPGAGAALSSTPISQESHVDIKELRETHPDLAQALVAEGRIEGAASELARVTGCLNAAIPGYESVALKAALDGKTQPGEAALAINAAQKADLQAANDRIQNGGPAPLPPTADAAAKEAEAARTKNAGKTPDGWNARITAHMTKAEAEGRKLTAAQAAVELRKQEQE